MQHLRILVAAFWLISSLAVAQNYEAKPYLNHENASGSTLFRKMSPTETGIDLTSRLDWKHRLGFLFFSNGAGGLAVGDVDGNGLADVFVIQGPDANRLYLQESPWNFRDSTASAGLAGTLNDDCGGDAWGMGAAMLDIDNDRDLDIYVVNYDSPNRLYINDGSGKFTEQSKAYGLDLVGPTTMASFCDYDRDGDLDLYLVNNRYMDEREFGENEVFYLDRGQYRLRPEAKRYFEIYRHDAKPDWQSMWVGQPDRLLTNQGPGNPFKDDSAKLSGSRGDGLSATWWDYDHDGWPDLYVCNDLASPDHLYRNNGDGTFSDRLMQSIPHTPWFAMGSCSGDINNDGLVDFLAADMAFRTHYKDKVFMGNMGTKFDSIEYFPPTQLMRNALYINTGTERFQEAAFLTGLAETEWTWTTSLADFDNDGRLDAYFTNGTPVNMQAPEVSTGRIISTARIRKQYQDHEGLRETNLAFRNLGGLKFKEVGNAWGLDHQGMSFTAIHVDLDRDGDLDLISWDLDEPISLYRNDSHQGNSVIIELVGDKSNAQGIGATIRLTTQDGEQVRQVYPVSGFKGCHEAKVHFGLGATEKIALLQVDWPSGMRTTIRDINANRQLRIREVVAGNDQLAFQRQPAKPLFQRDRALTLASHYEEPYDDFDRQPLLPNQLSQLGPGMAWGDVNADGLEDVFIGGSAGWSGRVYLNRGKGKFEPTVQLAMSDDAGAEDMGCVFLDVDGDNDLDLFVASGGVECERGDPILINRLYLNNGTGTFTASARGSIPNTADSSHAVAACDFDHDGDTDLFVGSRSIPGKYPLAPQHELLEKVDNRFVSHQASKEVLGDAGMITSAVWSDVDNDGWADLMLACDWGTVRFLHNQSGKLVDRTDESGLSKYKGWWNSLTPLDVDSDGDVDFAAGNFGLNTKYHASTDKPTFIYYGDYGDGNPHILEAEFEDNILYPMRGKSCSSRAMPFLKEKYKTYEQFAMASLNDIYTPKCIERSTKFEVNTLESGIFINEGNRTFSFRPFPREAQIAPVFGIVAMEINGDGRTDLFLTQNFYNPQKETGPMDGGVGLVLLNDGETWQPVRADRAGISIPADARSASRVDLNQDGWGDLCVATNNGPVYTYVRSPEASKQDGTTLAVVGPPSNRLSAGAVVRVASKQDAVRHYTIQTGSGYLSQESPHLALGHLTRNALPAKAKVTWPDGHIAEITIDSNRHCAINHPESASTQPTEGASQDYGIAKRQWLSLNLDLAQEFLAAGDLDQSARAIRRVLTVGPEAPAGHLIHANILRRQGRFTEARDVLTKLFQAGGSKSPEVLLTSGRVLHDLKRYDEAMLQYNAALSLAPDREDIKVIVTDTLVAQGRIRSALGLLSQIKSPSRVTQRKLKQLKSVADEILTELRSARDSMKSNPANGIKAYERVLTRDGDSLEALNNLAWYYATNTKAENRDGWRAVRYAERAKKITGGKNASVLDTLSVAYAEAQDFEKAISIAESVLAAPALRESQRASTKKKLERYRKRLPIRAE